MDMQLLGETIALEADVVQYGFWMPASGSAGVAGIEMFRVSTAGVFTVYLQTKSSDSADPSSTTDLIGSVAIGSTTPASFTFNFSGAKDLVRYLIKTTGKANLHFQFAQPLWLPN